MSFASLRSVAVLVASAVLGGVVAVGAVALLGGLDGDTTIVTETAAASGPGLAPASAAAMSINEIYERAAPGVVRVNRTTNSTSTSSDPQSGLGSGFVIDKTGHIVTNYHVVEGAERGHGQLLQPRHGQGRDRRHRPVYRPRRPPRRDVRERAHAASARQLRQGPRRRPGRRDRQPVRARPDGDVRDRERPPAPDHRARTASRSTTSSRPTRRSTPATRAARS